MIFFKYIVMIRQCDSSFLYYWVHDSNIQTSGFVVGQAQAGEGQVKEEGVPPVDFSYE